MARILLSTFGSSGDLNPFLAVGLGLRARGHEVTFAVERNFQQPVNVLGFPVALLTGDAETTLMHRADRTLEQSNLPRNLAGTRQPIRPQPSRQLPAPRSRLSRKPRKPLSTVPFDAT